MGPLIQVILPVFQVTATGPKVGVWLQNVYEEEFPKIKEELIKKGYKKIKAVQTISTQLPHSCPLCSKPDGHPIFHPYKRIRSEHRSSVTKNDQIRFKLYYNHSKPRYHQCFIGYFLNGYIQRSKKIDPEKMNPENWINDDKIEWFEPPKFKKPRKLS